MKAPPTFTIEPTKVFLTIDGVFSAFTPKRTMEFSAMALSETNQKRLCTKS